MQPVIEIRGVTKRFGKKTVLDNVTLSVPRGTVFGLIGENGAGKSTLIRGLLGYHKFNSGTVSVSGINPVKAPLALRRKTGYVSDAPSFYEWMKVIDVAWYAAGFYPDGFLDRFCVLATTFELPQATRVRDLSKGMKSKLALALAMAFQPELLVLDEPTSGLDPVVRRSFLESMAETAAEGRTVFISSHQIHELERIVDYIAILHKGEIKFAGPLDELKNDVQLLSFSQRDPLVALPTAIDKLNILRRQTTGRTLAMLVRGLTNDTVEQLSRHTNLFDVKAIRPSLEELYVGFTRDSVVLPSHSSSRTEVA